MKHMTLKNIAQAVGGALHMEGAAADVSADSAEALGVVHDSRQVEKGFLFIATVGERVDGHSFIDSVFEKGALGVVCEKAPQNPKGPYILVKDSFQALKDMAEFYLSGLDVKVVGITGSVGKTSTKEFVASVLAKKYRVQKTEGNFNNEVGLPLTALKIREDCEVAVLEMGISDFGEMHRLSKIAKPDICVITNIGQCHLENLGTRDGILKAKTEIFDYMKENAGICLNGDDDKLATVTDVKGVKPLFFGSGNKCSVYADDYENKGLDGSSVMIHINTEEMSASFRAEIPLPGAHMVYNALAATTVGIMLGLDTDQIRQGIADVESVGGRSHIIHGERFTVIDDCYNANPVSMKAAIDLLTMSDLNVSPRRVAILGDMFELGKNERELHAEVGRYARNSDVHVLICVGDLCKSMYEAAVGMENIGQNVYYFADKDSMLCELETILQDKDTVLVKASHGMHFEEVVARL
ncbi:MAG: UDP-N-acetylmuramoyl-tripeptide--D-alanyl-D-alanine ligase [Lachnospiraceae bacterium]|nr:UDP-N-acetylmuramoyl-tripeptide--D-alanyl-D-alanine ligase [Lachnospiraceae bacterium]